MQSKYTGHKNTKMPDGKTIVEWLRPTVDNECEFYGVPHLTDEQIAIVVSCMRMHHLLVHAGDYDFSELGKPDEITPYWTIESSIGRYFRDSARDTLDEINIGERKK